LSAVQLLREFLRGDTAVPGVVSRVPEVAEATTVEERAAAAVDWLSRIRDVAAQYLPADMPGATEGGAFTSVPTRTTASNTPIFRDLAPDVYRATGLLINIVEREAEALAAGTDAAGGPLHDTGAPVVIPEGGTF
jgi:hypothetical protein